VEDTAVKDLRRLVVALVVLVIFVNVVEGQGGGLVPLVTGLLAGLTENLSTLLLAVALPALLAGGLIYLSPWHRELGLRVMASALAVLVVAKLGPAFLHWLGGALAAYGQRLFGGQA
jgi:hypothetical protein